MGQDPLSCVGLLSYADPMGGGPISILGTWAAFRQPRGDRERPLDQERQGTGDGAAIANHHGASRRGGWRLHSLQPVPIFGGITCKQSGVELLAIFDR